MKRFDKQLSLYMENMAPSDEEILGVAKQAVDNVKKSKKFTGGVLLHVMLVFSETVRLLKQIYDVDEATAKIWAAKAFKK